MTQLTRILTAIGLSLLAAAPAPGAARATQKKIQIPFPVPAPLLAPLGLNGDQQTKLKAAGEAYEAELTRIKSAVPAGELKPALAAASAAYLAALEGALTPAQREQLDRLNEEAGQYRVLGELSFYLVTLNLTAEQKAKIRASIDRYQPDLERLGAASKLDNDANAAQRAAELRRKLVEEVLAALTAEQRQSLPAPKKKQ